MPEPDLQKYQRLEEENKRLRRAVDELAILNDLALEIGGSMDSEKIMRTIISRSIRAVEAEQGDITLVAENQSDPTHTLVRSMVTSVDHSPLHLDQNLLGWMQINRKPLLINDPDNDSRFQYVDWERSIRSLLCVPMMVKSKLAGMLTIYNKKDEGGFTNEDQRLLSIIAAQSAQIVENARLYEEEKELMEMRKELELAAQIQDQLLPNRAPRVNGYQICGRNITAQAVGGDYYDFVQIDETRWAIILGDVSGKGLPASLLMSNLQAVLRGQVLHDLAPSRLLRHANELLYHSTSAEKFATLFMGVIDTADHTFHYSNGGHEYPYVCRVDGALDRLRVGGVPLGMLRGQEYQQSSVTLQPGDHLVIYSDGVTDNMNGDEEEFGEERLEALLSRESGSSSGEGLLNTIIDATTEHSGQKELFDDITLVVLSRRE